MAGAFSDYLEGTVLAWLQGTAMPASPTNVYVGLFTALPADTGTSGSPADGTEVTSSNGYARVAVAVPGDVSPIIANGTTQQFQVSNSVIFPQATGSWGTVVGYGVWDAASSGHLLWYDALTAPQAIGTNQTPSLAAGQIIISLD
jgi:hypothetical protein